MRRERGHERREFPVFEMITKQLPFQRPARAQKTGARGLIPCVRQLGGHDMMFLAMKGTAE
jgi:hypothetical protein